MVAKLGQKFVEQTFSLRLDRFDHPGPRGLVARSSAGDGCIFVDVRGDGAVRVLELTIDGREPREPQLLRAQNPGAVAFTSDGDRAWVIVDDVLHTLNLATMVWDGELTIPKGVAKARLVSSGEDQVLLGPATTQVRSVWQATRNPDGSIDLSDRIDTFLPTVVAPGERWYYGESGRVERRESGVPVTDSQIVPQFVEPRIVGNSLFALAVDKNLLRTGDILRLDGEPLLAARKVCRICGVDGQGRLVVVTEAGKSLRLPAGESPSRLELLATDTLRSLARQSIGASARLRAFALVGAGTLAILAENSLKLVTWDGSEPTPRMTRAVFAS